MPISNANIGANAFNKVSNQGNQGGAQNGTVPNQPNGAVANQPADNNNKDNLINPWEVKITNDSDATGRGGSQPNQPVDGGKKPTFDDLVNGMTFGQINESDIAKAVQEGDYASLVNAMNTIGRDAYKKAMIDASTLVNSQMKVVKDDAVNSADVMRQASDLIGLMHESLPFTANKVIEPVAKSVLAGYKNQGLTDTESVAQLKKYFLELNKETSGFLGLNQNQQKTQDEMLKGNTDWSALLNS